MKRLTNEEIERFASRRGVRRIAVENFLMSMGTDRYNAINNCYLDRKLYSWNSATVKAILSGIDLASGYYYER